MNNIHKLVLKIILSTFSAIIIFLAFLTFSTIFAKDAHAQQGFGWAHFGTAGAGSCTSTTSRIIATLYTESGGVLNGGSITINGVTGVSGGDFGCMATAGNFYVTAGRSSYNTFSSAFSMKASAQPGGRNHVVPLKIYLVTRTPSNSTIEIISPTSGNIPTSPVSFQLYTRALPAVGCGSATIWAIVDGSYTQVASSASFGNISVSVSMSNETHSVAF